MLPTLLSSLRRHCITLLLLAVLAGSFLTYTNYRQKYIGAVDWYGYFQEAKLFMAGRLTLPTEFAAADYPAIVPFGFNVTNHGTVVPQYPPGFPLLLAAAGFVRLEFFVTPLIGVASCLLLFMLVADLTGDRRTALIYALLWAFFPTVVFGSTTMMSDLVAAFFVAASYYAYRRGAQMASAFLLAFALCVRPTNVLYLLVFSLVLIRDGRLIRYALLMLIPGCLYGLYNYYQYGAPWRTGYFDIRSDLVAEVFPQHSWFYLKQTALQCGPLVIFFCAWAFRRPKFEKFIFVAWFAAFLLFYSFWRPGGDRWWWTRFLLPGFIPIFLLSAQGFSEFLKLLENRLSGIPRQVARFCLFAFMVVTPVYYVDFGLKQADLWIRNKGEEYFRLVKETEQYVSPGSYVGSVEFAGSFRLYTNLGSFVSVHDNSLNLVPVLIAKHDVYLIVESWNKDNPIIALLMERYSAVKVREISVWGGVPLYRLTAPSTK
mgnify:CR=1 FL=1